MHRNQEAGPRRVARAVTCLALGLAAALSFGGTAVADQAGTEERITSSGERPLAPVSVPNYGTTTREGAPVAVVVSADRRQAQRRRSRQRDNHRPEGLRR